MKKIIHIVTGLMLIFATIVTVADTNEQIQINEIIVGEKTWVSIDGAQPGSEPEIKIIESNSQQTVINLILPGFWVENIEILGSTYQEISVPGESTTMQIHEPAVPIIRSLVAIPDDSIVTPLPSEAAAVVLEDYCLTVFEEPTTDTSEIQTRTVPSGKKVIQPKFTVQTSQQGIWRDVTVTTVELAPIQYNSETKSLTVTPYMTITLEYNSLDGSPLAYPDTKILPHHAEMYNTYIVNYEHLQFETQYRNSQNTQYLIITHPNFESAIQPLADWHYNEGYITEVITLTTSDYNTVKSEITSRYNDGDLEYVLLVGDTSYMPIAYWSGDSDYYYACINGAPDLFADIALGRLSVNSVDEATNQVNKILVYEQAPPMDDWLQKIILVAHKEGAPGKYVGCKEDIRTQIIPDPPFIVDTAYGSQSSGTNAYVTAAIDEGRNVVNYRGHGSQSAWTGWSQTSEYFDISNVNALNNGDRTPVVFNIACNNHEITTSCFGEAFMNKYPGGAVASLGATKPSYTIPNHDYDKELFRQFTNYGQYHIGWIGNAGATYIVNNHGSLGEANAKMYLWLGDPSTEIWTDIPGDLTVDYPPTIPYGQSIIEIEVTSGSDPVENALVCLMQPDGCYASGYTDATGMVELEVLIDFPDEATLTVTAHDCLPFSTNVQIGSSYPPLPPEVNGTAVGKPNKEYTFEAETTDPEGDQIMYLFDWGDGTQSDWIGPVDSGTSVSTTHAWPDVGNYSIKVRAKDIEDAVGYWSDPYLIHMTLPLLNLGTINGGLLKASVNIRNYGLAEADDINWKIELDGGFILMGKETTGTIPTIEAGGVASISTTPIFGFGPTRIISTIEIEEGDDYRSQGATILFFFVNVKPGGG